MGGDKPAPAPTPAKIKPLARPRSRMGIQEATNRFPAGYTTDSPIPRANRAASKMANDPAKPDGARPVNAVNIPHHTVPSPMTIRGPKRSAIRPAGAWNNAYPATNALAIQPN